jgi:hypothetical protein
MGAGAGFGLVAVIGALLGSADAGYCLAAPGAASLGLGALGHCAWCWLSLACFALAAAPLPSGVAQAFARPPESSAQ